MVDSFRKISFVPKIKVKFSYQCQILKYDQWAHKCTHTKCILEQKNESQTIHFTTFKHWKDKIRPRLKPQSLRCKSNLWAKGARLPLGQRRTNLEVVLSKKNTAKTKVSKIGKRSCFRKKVCFPIKAHLLSQVYSHNNYYKKSVTELLLLLPAALFHSTSLSAFLNLLDLICIPCLLLSYICMQFPLFRVQFVFRCGPSLCSLIDFVF